MKILDHVKKEYKGSASRVYAEDQKKVLAIITSAARQHKKSVEIDIINMFRPSTILSWLKEEGFTVVVKDNSLDNYRSKNIIVSGWKK